MVFTASLIMLLISCTTLYLLRHQVWIGAQFTLPPDSNTGVIVANVYRNGPGSTALSVGQKLVAISDGENSIPLDSITLNAPITLPTYEAFNRSITVQDQIWKTLQNDEIEFQTDNGEWVVIQPNAQWPIQAIPAQYWIYSLLSYIGIVSGILVWIRKPGEPSRVFIQFIVWGIPLTLNAALLTNSELAHPAQYIRTVSALESFGTNLILAAITGLFLAYPKRIAPSNAAKAIPLIAMLFPINSTMQWIEFPIHAHLSHFLITTTVILITIYIQWRKSQNSPVDRAQLKVTIFGMIAAISLPFSLYVIPTALNVVPPLRIDAIGIAISAVGTALTLGILINPIPDIDRWLVKSYLWLISGVLVILSNLAFATFGNLEPTSTLTIALTVTGLLHFPLNHLLLNWLLPDHGKTIQRLLPEFAAHMRGAITPADFEQRWLKLLATHFSPEHVKKSMQTRTNSVLLLERGLTLVVPTLHGSGEVELTGKNGGVRLFHKRDVRLVSCLLSLGRLLQDASDARRRTIIQERAHIMTTLQTTLGTKIRSLADNAPGKDERFCAQNALTTLDDTVHYSLQEDPIVVPRLISTWKREFTDRLKVTKVHLDWESQLKAEISDLSPIKAMILTNFLRESLTNALKHANPRIVIVRIVTSERKIVLTISNDGDISSPEHWTPCSGLSGMRSRIQLVGGELQLKPTRYNNQTFLELKAVVPINNG